MKEGVISTKPWWQKLFEGECIVFLKCSFVSMCLIEDIKLTSLNFLRLQMPCKLPTRFFCFFPRWYRLETSEYLAIIAFVCRLKKIQDVYFNTQNIGVVNSQNFNVIDYCLSVLFLPVSSRIGDSVLKIVMLFAEKKRDRSVR